MPFWRPPELPDTPEGLLPVPDDAGDEAREAIAAFNAGDFSRCRRLLRKFAGPDAAEADASVARELERRLRMDPVLLGIAAVSLLLLIFLTIWAVTVSH
jgi:hypothetical protein